MSSLAHSVSASQPRPFLLLAFGLSMLLPLGHSGTASAQEVRHPLDPLTWDEYWTIVEVLKQSERTDEKTKFWLVNLKEPPKSDVLAWQPGDEIPRSAFAVLRQGPKIYEAAIDLADRKVTSWEEVEGVSIPVDDEERDSINVLVKKNVEWRAAMERRGITDLEALDCWVELLGYFATAEQLDGRRVARVSCELEMRSSRYFPGPSGWIGGITVLVDADNFEILQVVEEGAAPIRTDDDYEAVIDHPREVRTPITVEQPLGPSFELEGHRVSWQKWSFHFRVDPRVGLVISDVRYKDGERTRSIMYQGMLAEIFVPYMDPSLPWYDFNFFDTGGSGFAVPLEPDLDCPENAVYFDALVARYEDGQPKTAERSACLFERYSGDVAWRHQYGGRRAVESRAARDLVLRMVARLGNYDYFFDWVFQQNGAITVRVGATGMDNVKIVPAPVAVVASGTNGGGTNGDEAAPAADAYGRYVAKNVVAVNHDHFFSFRLDLDVDGPENSFERDALKTVRLPDDHSRKSLWVVESSIARVESDGKLRIDLERPSLWRVINPQVKNRVGYPVSYQIVPRSNLLSLMDSDDYPQRRGGFIDYHLWVTPYNPNELYVGGLYPAISRDEPVGLPAWTAADRSIVNTDIVVWYTFGMHHVPRSEDWPLMPTAWYSFEIRPFDFFDHNPALDLPKRQ